MLRYNTGMRFCWLVLMLALIPALAWAADDPCPPRVRAVADTCCQAIEAACATVKYRPRCDWPEHRCAAACRPATRCYESEPPCHQPLAPCDPCSCAVVVAMCHMPAVPLLPCDPCESEPALTGGWHLLGADCAEGCCR